MERHQKRGIAKEIAKEKFEVFLTGDKNMQSQQHLVGLPFAILILSAINWPVVRPHVHQISLAISECKPGTVVSVACGEFSPRRR
jgi:hypothetical protein